MPIDGLMNPDALAPCIRPSGRNRRVAAWLLAVGLLVVVTPAMASGSSATPSTPVAERQSRDEPEPLDEEALKRLQATLERAAPSPSSPDDPFGRLVDAKVETNRAAIARMDATSASNAANVVAFNAAMARDKAQTFADTAAATRNRARQTLEDERRRLSDLTVRAYVTGGSETMAEYKALIDGDTTDPEAQREILFTQVLQRQEEVTAEAVKELNRARTVLVLARLNLDAAKREEALRMGQARTAGEVQAKAAARHEAGVAEVADAEGRLRSAGRRGFGIVPETVPLIGLPRLTAQDLSSWFAGTYYRPRVATPISKYAEWFIEEGMAEGVRGDIAFAQAVLETGGFANNDSVLANNFSGIGHCDTCPSGWAFPSPRLGVRAQIQLLKSYAIAGPDYSRPLVDRRLRGPAGCCEVWGDLTTVWATDPTYGPKVMLIYSDIVAHALARRAAGQGFDDPVPIPALPDE